MNAKLTCLLIISLMSVSAFSENLGHYGEVFPVLEVDIRQVISARLQQMEHSGELAHYVEEAQTRVSNHIIRPKPLVLQTTTAPISFHVDPTITVTQDIWAPNGLQVARAGTKLNPFDTVTFSKTLIFFNGDDKYQVAWVKQHYQDYQHVKFILTGGDIRDAANHFGRIYFDMGGRLTTLLQIKHVPSVVNQDGRRWKIQEIGVNDE